MEIKIISLSLSYFLLIFLLLTCVLSLRIGQNATYQYEPKGSISPLIAANEGQFQKYPSQYFMCGFSLKKLRWGVMKNNCNCRLKRISFMRFKFICNSCMNYFWNMNNGIKLIFCHYKSWNLQTTKTFELPSNEPSEFRQNVMCPVGYYVRTVGGRSGHFENNNLGLAGLSANCFTINLLNQQHIQDNSNFATSMHHSFSLGAFVSGAKLLSIGSKLVGIYLQAEYMPVVTKVQISYLSAIKNETFQIFDQMTAENSGFEKMEKRITYNKKFSATSIWNQKSLKTEGYHFQISPDQKINLPDITLERGDLYTPYQSFNGSFNFNKPLMSIYQATQNSLIIVPSCTAILAKCIVTSQKGPIAYKANVTYSGLLSGATIIVKEVTGVWQGAYISGTKIIVDRNSIPDCRSKNNNGRNNLR